MMPDPRLVGAAAALGVTIPVFGQFAFGPPQPHTLPGWGEGNAAALGDFDRDGDLDLAGAGTYNPIDGRITVFTNDGSGGFGSPVSYPAGGSGPTGLVVTDLNRDGWPDLVYTLFSPGSSVRTLINNHAGLFDAGQILYSGNATHLAAGDLNGDLWPDVVASNSQIGTPNAKVFLNNGAGALLPGVEYAVAGAPRSVTIADLDGDTNADLVVPSLYQDVVSILRNQGDGTFAPMQNYPVGIGACFAAARDFDADGDTDLAVSSTGAQFTSDVSLLFNHGNGTFASAVNYAVGYNARGIVGEDLDNDGDFDLGVIVMPQSRVFVLANNGDGTFAAPVAFATGVPGDGTYHLVAGDVSGDGRVDLAASNVGINHGLVVLINQTDTCYADCTADGALTAADFGCFQTRFVAGDPYADCNADGQLTVADFGCFQTRFVLGCP